MKMRILCVAVLGLMLVSGLSLSQESTFQKSASEETLLEESSPPKPVPEEPTSMGAPESPDKRRNSVARTRTAVAARTGLIEVARSRASAASSAASSAKESETLLEIFTLKYYPAENLGNLVAEIFDVQVHAIGSNNSLIIKATAEQMDKIEALIAKLDVESELPAIQSPDNLIYRVYMFEISSKDQPMKPFSMIIRMPSDKPSSTVLENAAEVDIQISDFQLFDEKNDEVYILIQGKAPSKESIQHISAGISNYQIRELRWDDDETFTRDIGAADYSQLPEQMQKYIQKFLGPKIETVGYWFGSSSVPGEIEAPIGPWNLRLELNPQSDRTLELRVEVKAPEELSHFDRQLGRERSDQILSNTIQVKAGKSVIVGYNRPSYGTRKMGAMVIIPEVDTVEVPK